MTETLTFTPTAEQQALVNAAMSGGNLFCRAYAGCAKTSTLELIARALPPIPSLALAFNVKNRKDLEKRFPANFTVKTLNGLGHSAWQKAIGKRLEIDEKKLGRLVTAQCKEEGFSPTDDQWSEIRQLVTAAMNVGLVPHQYPHKSLVHDTFAQWKDIADDLFTTTSDVVIELARDVLLASIKESFAGIISYDDQIYMSAMFNGVFPRFMIVMVDEAQDLSPLNHIQVKRCAADRLIVVGDEKQSIYAFRGADTDSMNKLHDLRSEWHELPLTLTFRCPQRVVARHQEHAPGFRAWETNETGLIETWIANEQGQIEIDSVSHDGWTWNWVEHYRRSPRQSIAVLCRNNAPLLAIAFKLLKQRVGVTFLGRDIGKSLVALSRKVLPDDDMPLIECITTITEWMKHEIELARANEKEEKVASITDRGECLLAVAEGAQVTTALDLRNAIKELFAREHGTVTLSTGHRAKGLEWDIVVHLDPWRIPSKYARAAASRGKREQLQQELNLRYVIETRTRGVLVSASLRDFVEAKVK